MLRSALLTLALLAVAACDQPAADDNATGLANPAATYCIEQGGKYEIKDGADGQTGTCTLANGMQQDAWDFFRAENMQ